MPNPVSGAAIDAGVGLVQSIGSAIYNSYWQNENYRRTLNMLEDQRKYDSPSAQMQRLKDAGLNPNLIYGQMQSSASPTPLGSPSSPPTFVSNFQNAVMSQKQMEVMDAEIDKTNAEAELTRSQVPESATRQKLNEAEADYKRRLILSQYIIDKLNEANIRLTDKQGEEISAHIQDLFASANLKNSQSKLVDAETAYQLVHNQFAEKEFQTQIDKMLSEINVNGAQANLFRQQLDQNAQMFVHQLAIIANQEDISSSDKEIKAQQAVSALSRRLYEEYSYFDASGQQNFSGFVTQFVSSMFRMAGNLMH